MSRSRTKVMGYVDSNSHSKRLSNRKFRGNVKPHLQDCDEQEHLSIYDYDAEAGIECYYDYDPTFNTEKQRYTPSRQAHRKMPQAGNPYDLCDWSWTFHSEQKAVEHYSDWWDHTNDKERAQYRNKQHYIDKNIAKLKRK